MLPQVIILSLLFCKEASSQLHNFVKSVELGAKDSWDFASETGKSAGSALSLGAEEAWDVGEEAGSGIVDAAKETGHASKSLGKKTASALETGAEVTWDLLNPLNMVDNVESAAKFTGKLFEKGGKEAKDIFKRKKRKHKHKKKKKKSKQQQHGYSRFKNNSARLATFTIAPRGPPIKSIRFSFTEKEANRKCFCSCQL